MKDESLTRVLGIRPLTIETLPAGLEGDLTPIEALFVRNNRDPAPAAADWSIEVIGAGERTSMSIEELFAALERVEVRAVLQCAGNGRSRSAEPLPGVQWDVGAVGCVEWSGVRVADLIAAGGLDATSSYLTALGGDGSPDDPERVERSVPLGAALEAGILADRLNGEPLPTVHGGPLRFVMPGFFAVNSVKWLRRLTVTPEETDADIQRLRYRMTPPGEEPSLQHEPLWRMFPTALITAVGAGSVRGLAFAGGDEVVGVDVSLDGETWSDATLGPDHGRFAWRRFQAQVPADSGWVAARCRTAAAVQAPHGIPNREGYAVTGWRDLAVSPSP